MFTSKKLFLSLLLLSTLQTAYSTGWFTAAPKPSFFGWLFTPTPQPTFLESTQALITENPKTTLGIIAVGAATVYGVKKVRDLKKHTTSLEESLNKAQQEKDQATQKATKRAEQFAKLKNKNSFLTQNLTGVNQMLNEAQQNIQELTTKFEQEELHAAVAAENNVYQDFGYVN